MDRPDTLSEKFCLGKLLQGVNAADEMIYWMVVAYDYMHSLQTFFFLIQFFYFIQQQGWVWVMSRSM